MLNIKFIKEDKNKKIIVKKIDGKYVETGKVILKNNQILIIGIILIKKKY